MSYLPRKDPELVNWFHNFATKFITHGPALGFAANEVTGAQDDAAWIQFLIGQMQPIYRSKMQEVTKYKDLMKHGPIGKPAGGVPVIPTLPPGPAMPVEPGIIPRLNSLVARIKKSTGYTPAIGQDLGIVAPVALKTAGVLVKPTFRATALPGSQVRLDWVKGKSDGVHIEGRRQGEPWTYLGLDRFSPFTDTRPPLTVGTLEQREYRMRYMKHDDMIGDWSDTVSAVIIV